MLIVMIPAPPYAYFPPRTLPTFCAFVLPLWPIAVSQPCIRHLAVLKSSDVVLSHMEACRTGEPYPMGTAEQGLTFYIPLETLRSAIPSSQETDVAFAFWNIGIAVEQGRAVNTVSLKPWPLQQFRFPHLRTHYRVLVFLPPYRILKSLKVRSDGSRKSCFGLDYFINRLINHGDSPVSSVFL